MTLKRNVSIALPYFFPAILAFLVICPLLSLFLVSPDADRSIFLHIRDTQLFSSLLTTFQLGLGVACGTLLIGISTAWIITRFSIPFKRTFEILFLLPLAIPGYIYAFVYQGIFEHSGPVQQFLRTQLNIDLDLSLRHLFGACLVLSLAYYPYVYILARGAFLNQSQNLLDASRILGCGPWGFFFRVALPAAAPAIFAGLSLVLMETFADFGAVSILGVQTLTVSIYKSWFALYSLQTAARLAILLLVLVSLTLFLIDRAQKRGIRYLDFTQSNKNLVQIHLKTKNKILVFTGTLFLIFMSLILPVTQLFYWAGSSWKHQNWPQLALSLASSLSLGLIGATIVLISAIFLALSLRVKRNPILRILRQISLMGYAFPGTVLAVGIFATLSRFDHSFDFSWALAGSLAGLILGLGIRFLAVSYKPIQTSLEKISPSLDNAAQSLGSSFFDRVRRIHLPILWPALMSAFLLTFIDIVKEMPLTLMTRPIGWDTLSVRIFQFTAEGNWQHASIASLILILLGLIASLHLIHRLKVNT